MLYILRISLGLLLFVLVSGTVAKAQDSGSTNNVDQAFELPHKLFSFLIRKATKTQARLDKQTNSYLSDLQNQERKLKRAIAQKDSALAEELFRGTEDEYSGLKNKNSKTGNTFSMLAYSGHLDSLTTALDFVKQVNPASIKDNPEAIETLNRLKSLKESFKNAEQIKQFLRQREEFLKQQSQRFGMARELKKYKQNIYYFQAQVQACKEAFNNPEKLEQKLLEFALKVPAFKEFFTRNSQLSSLFSLQPNYTASSLQGLQTRVVLQQSLQDRFGSSANVIQTLQQNLQAGQAQLSVLQEKASSIGTGSFGNAGTSLDEQPDFKPNTQKTKTFLERLEVGSNLQSQKSKGILPTTSDLGLSLGYKVNDNSVLGLGASYKVGWGNSLQHIKMINEGVGLRSFLDYKIKGSFYASGGYELNYRTTFRSIGALKSYSAWQKSGLIGLSKKYQLSKKIKGQMQLLFDFLSYQQIPKTQPLLFRIGYTLNKK